MKSHFILARVWTSSVLKFCADEGASLNSISLGQGQGVKAEALIDRGIKDGSWVFLMNCHLATYWMPMLEKICEGFEGRKDDIHDSFRLWCTTYPSNDFPVSVLQNAIKMSFEPPSGMRANLLGSYTSASVVDTGFNEYMQRIFAAIGMENILLSAAFKDGMSKWESVCSTASSMTTTINNLLQNTASLPAAKITG